MGLVGEEIGRGQCGDLAALADIADGRGWDLLPRGRSRAGVGNLPLGAAAANTREKLREGVRSAVAPGWSGRRPDRDCALPQPLLLPPPSDRPGPARKSHWELCLDPATLSPVLKTFLCPPPPSISSMFRLFLDIVNSEYLTGTISNTYLAGT